MDNKYGLGSAKVATAHHDAKVKSTATPVALCRFCNSADLIFSPSVDDHYCKDCGEYQSDVPAGYSTGHSADY
jgi:hypothetical protein